MSDWPEPTADAIDNQPDLDEVGEMATGEVDSWSTDGCDGIEPDGVCEHGYPSWPLYLGLI